MRSCRSTRRVRRRSISAVWSSIRARKSSPPVTWPAAPALPVRTEVSVKLRVRSVSGDGVLGPGPVLDSTTSTPPVSSSAGVSLAGVGAIACADCSVRPGGLLSDEAGGSSMAASVGMLRIAPAFRRLGSWLKKALGLLRKTQSMRVACEVGSGVLMRAATVQRLSPT
jgi:hypothetical protein